MDVVPRMDLSHLDSRRMNMQLGGIHHVTAVSGNASNNVAFYTQVMGMRLTKKTVNQDDVSARFLTDVLGFRRVGTYQTPQQTTVTIFEVGPGGAGSEVHVEIDPAKPFHRFVGIGGVHHVAWRTPNEEEHKQWRERIARVNPTVTPVIDRFYFRSIYFREPGGVLFEIATDGPGFAVDEDAATLGERLALPPFLEPHRAEIEAHLTPIQPVDAKVLVK